MEGQKQQVLLKFKKFSYYYFLPLKFTTPTAVEANLRRYTRATTIKLETGQETGENRVIMTNRQFGDNNNTCTTKIKVTHPSPQTCRMKILLYVKYCVIIIGKQIRSSNLQIDFSTSVGSHVHLLGNGVISTAEMLVIFDICNSTRWYS